MKLRRNRLLYLGLALAVAVSATAYDLSNNKVTYIVADAHLDTQWGWTLGSTIDKYIPSTLRSNFALFDKYPEYLFNFEGAYRYYLAKEYYPADYARLKGYIASGRWAVAGGFVDACDVNIPSAEALMRQILYGNGYFQDEFGKRSADVFLPDCFGFGAVCDRSGRKRGVAVARS
jgi:alpha-mannosidase